MQQNQEKIARRRRLHFRTPFKKNESKMVFLAELTTFRPNKNVFSGSNKKNK